MGTVCVRVCTQFSFFAVTSSGFTEKEERQMAWDGISEGTHKRERKILNKINVVQKNLKKKKNQQLPPGKYAEACWVVMATF